MRESVKHYYNNSTGPELGLFVGFLYHIFNNKFFIISDKKVILSNKLPAFLNPPEPMRIAVILIAVSVLAACSRAPKPHTVVAKPIKKVVAKPKVDTPEYIPEIKYTESQLIAFMDSVGRLPTQVLADKISRPIDSIGEHLTKPLNRIFSPDEFKTLQKAIKDSSINYKVAERLFGKLNVERNCTMKGLLDSVAKGSLYLQYFPFGQDKNAFDYFAVSVGDIAHCAGARLFYFKGSKLIASQGDDANRSQLESSSFSAPDGQPVFIINIELNRGSGIGWQQWYFFKYNGERLKLVLTELSLGDLMPGLNTPNSRWFDATILNVKPLMIKMVYYHQLGEFKSDTTYEEGPYVSNDSTVVSYRWTDKNTLEGKFEKSGISKSQTLTYNLDDNDLLFINTYQTKLQQLLNSKKRKWVLNYLNKEMNYEHRRQILSSNRK